MTIGQDSLVGITAEAMQALVEGRHGDPFSILGPHSRDAVLNVRALAPGAQSIDVIARESSSLLGRLELAHPVGLFAGPVTSGSPYRLRITWPNAVQETEDPYSFGLLLSDLDLHLIGQGTHYELARCLGAQPMTVGGVKGVRFAVWAPNARRVSVVGDFNSWDGRRHPMRLRREAGVWELFVPRLGTGALYKYEILGPGGGLLPQKADPVARGSEASPGTASIVASNEPFNWTDEAWIADREKRQNLDAPMSFYEVQAGSWLRIVEEDFRSLTWTEMGERLVPYMVEMGFTHLEFLPIAEYPFGDSWGYQPLGLFSPTGRYGRAEEFAALIDRCHSAGIGVIVDWVPAHFPTDVWGLARFDGTALYEHEDPREGFHKDWNTYIYNLGRTEVRGFLIASALEWLERYHIDGLRVDAVASMLYRDYSRQPGEWIPNRYGGRENLESIEFFKHLNSIVAQRNPGVLMIAEESTAWPKVTAPPEQGGLGFSLKWNMGWMHDTLHYMAKDPVYRSFDHNSMTFGILYAYSERFVLPLSHDEVVHGKRSLIGKMPGDIGQQFANLRAYLSWMWTFPGKKLLFMGGEIAQWNEWNSNGSIEWDLLDYPLHRGIQQLIVDLNALYRKFPALHATDSNPSGFQWVVADDNANSVYAYARKGLDGSLILLVSNMTPVPRYGYRLLVPKPGNWLELLNTDATFYGGSNLGNGGQVMAQPSSKGGEMAITLPALATIILAPEEAQI
ncbi:MAG: 1,4-alpha-glucan branching protein GlgB [Acidobacteriaceae bacterium]|nr:1,4-alpha-glucan branching protein GlgB [Acidobacteriaceae bacterium]